MSFNRCIAFCCALTAACRQRLSFRKPFRRCRRFGPCCLAKTPVSTCKILKILASCSVKVCQPPQLTDTAIKVEPAHLLIFICHIPSDCKTTSIGMSTDVWRARVISSPDADDTVWQALAPTEIPSQPSCFLSGFTAPVGAPCGANLHEIRIIFTKMLSVRFPYSPVSLQLESKTKLGVWLRERSKQHLV